VPLEERLVDANVLDADGAMVELHVDDAVDHQHRITMRDHLQDAFDVRYGGWRHNARLVGLHIHVSGTPTLEPSAEAEAQVLGFVEVL
jgi:hypothetical protein